MGQTVSLTAPAVSGYDTPSPATRSYVLGAMTNSYDLTYAPLSGIPATVTTAAGKLLETGTKLITVTCLAGLIITTALRVVYSKRKNYTLR